MEKKGSKNKEIKLNEKIIYECKTHWIVFAFPVFLAFFTLIGIIGVFPEMKTIGDILSLLISGIILIFLLLGIPYLVIKNRKLILTDKRIYGKTGIILTKTLSAPISKIQTVKVNTGLFGRMFGYSNLTIHCITGVYKFKNQSNAEEMQNAILNSVK